MLRSAGVCFAAAAVAYPFREDALAGGRLAVTAFLATVFVLSTVAAVMVSTPLRSLIAAQLRQPAGASGT
jgi:hypothetical protein